MQREAYENPARFLNLAGYASHSRGAQRCRAMIVADAPDHVHVPVDPLRMEQVVVNLLDNALKYSPNGGRIDVGVAPLGRGEATFAVRDNGIGVPREHRPHLFERFYRAHEGDCRSGMGLGLYISKEIVEQHGGTIEVQFPADGGTRFVVEISAVRQELGSEDIA